MIIDNKKIISFFLMAITVFSFLPNFSDALEHGTVIVKIKSPEYLPQLEKYGAAELLFNNIYRLEISDYRLAIIDFLRQQSWVAFVHEDAIVQKTATIADPLFSNDNKDETKQWYLSKIQVPRAWEKTTGRPETIVAVVDTGINGQHEDLDDGRVGMGFMSYCQSMKPNQNECAARITSQIDSGVNSDDNGHGTIVAGIIGAEANNGKGIAGINWTVKLMPIKVLDAKGEGLSSDAAVGIKWAVDHGAKIINLSIGGQGLEGLGVLQEAVSYAYNKNVLVIAAAGNDGAEVGGNLNTAPILPVCADSEQNTVIGVTAVDISDRKARFASYGSNCIDIAAPGASTFVSKQEKKGIVSTYYDPAKPGKNDLYVYALGTSLAAPIVSGVAALTLSAFPGLEVKALRDRLLASVDNIDQFNTSGCEELDSCVGQIGSGRVNAFKAVSDLPLFSGGTVVQSPSGLYLMERGLRRSVSDFVFKQRFPGTTAVQTPQEQVDVLPPGTALPPVDGSIVKDASSPTVYLVEGGELRPLSYLAFVSRRLNFVDVAILPDSELAAYLKGLDAQVVDGLLVKAKEPSVYIVRNGQRQIISYFVYKQRGLDRYPIAQLSPDEINQYPIDGEGIIYPPEDGTLIKSSVSPTVYVIENGARRGLTLQAFQSRGYSFGSVQVLPQSETDQYKLGADIIE